MNATWSALGWFALVVLTIPVALWLFKMSPLGRLNGLKPEMSECPMRPMSSLALSPSQKLVTVEVGQGAQRRWLVLGVTPSGITTLERIELSGPGSSGHPGPDPAWSQPDRHTGPVSYASPTSRPMDRAVEAADTGLMATQPLGRVPERSLAPVLPFAELLGKLRRPSQTAHHG